MPDAVRPATNLRDYRPPAYLIDAVELTLHLRPAATSVRALLRYRANPLAPPGQPLVLQGEQHRNVAVILDGVGLAAERYRLTDRTLELLDPPAIGTIEIRSTIDPEANTALEGLYLSRGVFCTQCEAEGFRRIAYFPDRPDVLARFTTKLIANKASYPVLLSNGNLVEHGDCGTGDHYAVWHDQFPKPCYLFALVAGELAALEDSFRTRSGRAVSLRIYSTPRNLARCGHAMASLKRAMRWDEERFGREYDLDAFMIFCADDFNMGAMENKGLNIFNSKYLLAQSDTATDADFEAVAAVVGHEYLHNWTGNRVTCRDWFQLSLKEGLTVFREQEFCADIGSRAVERIAAVDFLRAHQFPEDSGPMAHPVRPESYVEIDNFYTATVYEKGAEVIRMLHTLLGEQAFRRGMDLYFSRHDGQAVTCDDFVQAMQDASGVDLAQFRRWYSQSGTPVLHVRDSYDAETQTYTLHVRQSTPPTPDQPHKLPYQMPLALGLLDHDGHALRLGEESGANVETLVVPITRERHEIRFRGIRTRPIPSLLRGLSAPVRLEFEYSASDLAFLMTHDSDPVNRWNVAQTLWLRTLNELVAAHQAGKPLLLDDLLVDAFRAVLCDDLADPALRARALTLPDLTQITEQQAVIDVASTHVAREFVRRELARALREPLRTSYAAHRPVGAYELSAAAIARRALKNTCLHYLAAGDDDEARALCRAQFQAANNMTDSMGALAALNDCTGVERAEALAEFYARWQHEELVLDKWLSLQALSTRADTPATVHALLQHPAYDGRNPNRVRALIGNFALRNWVHVHAVTGESYGFIADQVIALDKFNPHLSSRIAHAFDHWRRFDGARQTLQRAALERITATAGLSQNVREIIGKSLGDTRLPSTPRL